MIDSHITKALEKALGSKTHLYGLHHVGGGFINQTYKATTSQGTYFIKVHETSGFSRMFEKEKHGLQVLTQTNCLNIAKPIEVCEYDKHSYLFLEWIESAPENPDYWSILGEGVAKIHKNTNRFFGFNEDNYFGSLVQINNRLSNWGQFFVKNRLMPLVKIATECSYFDKHTLDLFEKYYNMASEIFPEEEPSLLHGDLWRGNIMVNAQGLPCLVDPAVYYGHREMDISMSYFVGEFDAAFYEAYNGIYPLQEDWKVRRDFAMMYYHLAHLNLFGVSYIPMVMDNLYKWVGRR